MKRQELRVGHRGEIEFQFWECWEPDPRNPQGPERHWFRAANGMEAPTFEEMLDKMSGKFVFTPSPPPAAPEPWERRTARQVRIKEKGKYKDVLINIIERYTCENGTLTGVTVRGPNGLVTSSCDEMLELLGIAEPPAVAGGAGAENQLSAQEGELSVLSSQSSVTAARQTEPEFAVSQTGKLVANCANPLLLTAGNGTADHFASPSRLDRRYSEARPRWVRVGDKDVKVTQFTYYSEDNPQYAADRWFEAPDGTIASTYKEMLEKLGARPKPYLPEDEHRPAPAANAAPATFEVSPETGPSRCIADVSDAIAESFEEEQSASSADDGLSETLNKKKAYERPRNLGADPWALDKRKLRELSDAELEMRIIWDAEEIRDRNPDLYEAALDSVKRQEFLDRRKAENQARLAADQAPRCQFIKADGELCGSPAMKHRRFCYFHSRTNERRKKTNEVSLPVLEDDLSIQMAVTNVCRGLLMGNLDPRRASTLLYGLQVASVAVRKQNAARTRAKGDTQDVAY